MVHPFEHEAVNASSKGSCNGNREEKMDTKNNLKVNSINLLPRYKWFSKRINIRVKVLKNYFL